MTAADYSIQDGPARRETFENSRLINNNLQFDQHGELKHFLTIDGLPREVLIGILDTAESFVSFGKREIKKVPLLRGKTIVNLFFEPI